MGAVDESRRSIYSYVENNYYRPALNELIAQGYVETLRGGGYALTTQGGVRTKAYLMRVLKDWPD